MFCLHVCVPCEYRTHRDHRGASEPLELNLQMLASCQVGAGNQTRAPGSAATFTAETPLQPPSFQLILVKNLVTPGFYSKPGPFRFGQQ